jgi:Ca2+-transporting ATPase
MEGPVFRQLSQTDMIEPRLQVLARSSPEVKKVLVETLKMIGGPQGITSIQFLRYLMPVSCYCELWQ